MKTKNTSVGLIFVLVGILLLIHTLGLYTSNAVMLLSSLQPFLLILAGIFFIVRKPLPATVFLLLALLGFVSLVPSLNQSSIVIQQIERDTFESIKLNVNFNSGQLILQSQNQEPLVTNHVKSFIKQEPRLRLRRENNTGLITIDSVGVHPQKWNLTLDNSLPMELSLSYDAADAQLDLSALKLTNLYVTSGATNTKIRFPAYPMTAAIDTAASNLLLEFPRGVGVSMDIQGGAIDLNLQGFTFQEGKWTNDWYDLQGSTELTITAGASSIETRFFEAVE